MPEVGDKKQRRGLLHELVRLYPSIPYLGYGIWLVWSFLAYSGMLWVGDAESAGQDLSQLYIISTAIFGVVCLIAPFCAKHFSRALKSSWVVIGAGLLASIGSLLVLLAGVYGQHPIYTSVQFLIGALLTGAGTSIISLRCGVLYGALSPRRSLLYASLSQLVIVCIYFIVLGAPGEFPIAGMPSVAGVLAFVLLPLAAAALIMVPRAHEDEEDAEEQERRCSFHIRALPSSFWRLVVLSLFLSFAVSMMRSAVVSTHEATITLTENNILMLLRILIAVAFIIMAIYAQARQLNFGRIYTYIIVIMMILSVFAFAFDAWSDVWNVAVYFVSNIFEFSMWCLLAFVVFQRSISSITVFGFGRGTFMLASAIGWLCGTYFLPQIAFDSAGIVVYVLLIVIALIMAFMLFSEREFNNLFEPDREDEQSFEELLDIGLQKDEDSTKQGRFSKAIDALAEEYALSSREAEVLRYLAMGRGSDYIADELQIAWNTARSHTHNVYVKLNVHSRQELLDLMDKYMKD
ncbi:MAG: LuxR family transcriptional regulator [Bacteroidales bacterium]|nr:LuxR family transcriptional regulator [Bacteroidales bacterium]